MSQQLGWTDVLDIALALEDLYPNVDILSVRFTDLKSWIMGLPDFKGNPDQCNEKILEAIQMTWLRER
jgi:FeS assembly protein IscX